MFKKFAFSLFLCTLIANQALAQSNAFQEFTDVPPEHPNYNAISLLRYYGVIDGYADNSFRPEQPINRVEALKMIFEVGKFEVKPVGMANFLDTEKNAWYLPYLNRAVFEEVVSGYPDGTFKPAQTINLVEFLKILLKAQKADFTKLNMTQIPYTDVDPSQWYMKYLWFAHAAKLIDADQENKINPSQLMTRAKAAEIIFRYRKYQENLQNNLDPVKEDTSTTEQKPVSESYAVFSSDSYFFTINYPKKWFYSALPTNAEGVIRTYGFGSKELTDNEPQVKLELWPLATSFEPNYGYQDIKLLKEVSGDLIILTRKIDQNRVYRLIGTQEQLDNMLIMLNSISTLPKS